MIILKSDAARRSDIFFIRQFCAWCGLNAKTTIFSFLVFLLIGSGLLGDQTSVDDDKKVDEIIAEMKRALQKVDVISKHQADDTLALAAEWIVCRESIADQQLGGEADYFLGFVSGRLRVSIPKWWSDEVRRCGCSQDGQSGFDCEGIEQLWKENEDGWRYSGLKNVKSDATVLMIESSGQKVVLEKSVIADDRDDRDDAELWSPKVDGAVAGAIRDELCVVAFGCPTSIPGGANRIYCINVKTGEVCWMRKLESTDLPMFAVGGQVDGSFTEVIVDADRVMIWTGHNFSMCLEVFRRKDGKRLARFSTGQLDGLRLGMDKELQEK